MDSVLPLLRDLVAIPSINPSLAPGAPGEGDAAAYVGARLRAAGMDVEMYDVLPGRPNAVGIAEGRDPGPTLMFCGHLDTVGVEGMRAPFDPVERDGLLYGRGSQDMKGGVAAMIHAAESVLRRGGLRKGRLVIAAVADEEYASAGADALVARCTADYAVIPEPTDLQVGIAHKGFSAAEIVMHGRAAAARRTGGTRYCAWDACSAGSSCGTVGSRHSPPTRGSARDRCTRQPSTVAENSAAIRRRAACSSNDAP